MVTEIFDTNSSTNEFSLSDLSNILRVYMKKPTGGCSVYAWKEKDNKLVVKEMGTPNSERLCEAMGIASEQEVFGRRVVHMRSWFRENLRAYPVEAGLFRMGNFTYHTNEHFFNAKERAYLKELGIEIR